MYLVTVHEIFSGNAPDEQVYIVAAKIILLRQRPGGGTIIQMDDGQRIYTKETPERIADRLRQALSKKGKPFSTGAR